MKITSHASVVAETVQKILDVTITWTIDAAGKIDADIEATKDGEGPGSSEIWCENVLG